MQEKQASGAGGINAGLSMDAVTALVTAWGGAARRGDDRTLEQTPGGKPVVQTVILCGMVNGPLGEASQGNFIFDNGRLATARLDTDKLAILARLEAELGRPTLSWEEGAVWNLPEARAMIEAHKEPSGVTVELKFFGVAIEEGELTDAYYHSQQASFLEAVQESGR